MAYREINLTGQISAASISGKINAVLPVSGTIERAQSVVEKDYEQLENKPQINGVNLIKNKSFEELGFSELTALDVYNILDEIWRD
jgi:hypothetical protein